MNFGAFAGGAADGYRKQNEDLRKQSEEKRTQDETERQDADRKLDDDVNKQTAEYMKQRLGVSSSPVVQEKPVVPTAVIENPAAQGFSLPSARPEPTTFSDSVAQRAQDGVLTAAAKPSAPQSIIAANGIDTASPMRQEITKPEPVVSPGVPKVRQPDINDMVDVAQHRTNLYLQNGNYTKAIDAHKDYIAFAAEKLKGEEKQRAELAKNTVAGIMSGNYSGLSIFYDSLPDGGKLQSVTPNKDGTITVAVADRDGKEKPPVTFKNGEHLANAVVSLVDTNVALQYMDRNGKAEIEAGKTKFEQEDKISTRNESRRHNIATEGIARTKAVEGTEGSTAEIKNARVFFPDLYKENPAKALSAFKDITTGEITAAKVRQTLLKTYEEGFWPDEAGTTQKDRDAFINERVGFVMGKSDSSAGGARSGGAVKISTKKELDALPSGTLYTAPDGSTRKKQ